MALGNWESFAVNRDGLRIPEAEVTSPQGVLVEVYKNYLRVDVTGADFVVEAGRLTYKDVTIYAKRGPQDGVFAIVIVDAGNSNPEVMIACGVYGWLKDRWIGVDDTSYTFLIGMVKDHKESWTILNKLDLAKVLGRSEQ